MAEYGYRSPLYGHYGQGCVHLRINFDFRTLEGLRKFREFIDRAADLVCRWADRSPASMATGRRALFCFPRCLGRS
jgi:FAD/FMN-containing dehydrogenase